MKKKGWNILLSWGCYQHYVWYEVLENSNGRKIAVKSSYILFFCFLFTGIGLVFFVWSEICWVGDCVHQCDGWLIYLMVTQSKGVSLSLSPLCQYMIILDKSRTLLSILGGPPVLCAALYWSMVFKNWRELDEKRKGIFLLLSSIVYKDIVEFNLNS